MAITKAAQKSNAQKLKTKTIIKNTQNRTKYAPTKKRTKVENLHIWTRKDTKNLKDTAFFAEPPGKPIFPTGLAPSSGSSYNPNKCERAEALKKAYAVHDQRIAENKRVEAMLATYHSIEVEQERMRLLDKSEKKFEEQSEEKSLKSENRVKRKAKPKTRARLNKKRRLALEQLVLSRQKASKKKLADINRIDQIIAELDAEEAVQRAKHASRRKEETVDDESEILAVATLAKSSAACLRTVDAIPKRASLKGIYSAFSEKVRKVVG